MADIVQLEEKGNLLYPKTHVSAIDNLDEAVVKKTGDEEIAGVKNFKDAIQINGKNLLDIFYPVGAIFQTLNSTNPATLMGGTWERIKGKVLVGVDEGDTDFSLGKTGGSKLHDHGLSKAYAQLQMTGTTLAYKGLSKDIPEYKANVRANNFTALADSTTLAWGTALAGKTDSSSNLQPYTTVFMWKRIA
ncbi:phage baseplate protein [Enterococcus sp. UD-01]|jgi:hypothetical protein|uniref:phage baseplate protein n=1 Tax=Enterococcus sp. UD-01 TaxID=3373911 RepID=UPI0038357E4B